MCIRQYTFSFVLRFQRGDNWIFYKKKGGGRGYHFVSALTFPLVIFSSSKFYCRYYEELILRFEDGSQIKTILDRPTMEKINAGGLMWNILHMYITISHLKFRNLMSATLTNTEKEVDVYLSLFFVSKLHKMLFNMNLW